MRGYSGMGPYRKNTGNIAGVEFKSTYSAAVDLLRASRDELAKKIRLMKNFGFLGYDNVGYVGTNGKMNEFSAAMGLTTMESMHEFIAHNQRSYYQYRDELADIPGLRLLEYDERQRLNYHYVVTEVDKASAGISRDRLLDVLWAENILARRYFYPGCHRMQPYRAYFPNAGLLLEQTERVAARVLILPTGPTMAPSDVCRVCSIIRRVIENGPEISRRLERQGAGRHRDVFSQ
jgi:dTDP-4-amino-4,6-dideoxygalactose transaminase